MNDLDHRIEKSLNVPVGGCHSSVTSRTEASGVPPSLHQRRRAVKFGSSPSATMRTRPSERFSAKPASPRRFASLRVALRKNTPCTRPATVMTARLRGAIARSGEAKTRLRTSALMGEIFCSAFEHLIADRLRVILNLDRWRKPFFGYGNPHWR